jgi:natural product biosynthesis luciferase-like monooxygenase protein
VSKDAIAIIGLACRFPGATDARAFWRLLRSGGDAIREIPGDRWDVDQLFDPEPGKPGRMYTRWGGFIDDVDQFDPQSFGLSPREAESMDPQQRLVLEVASEAIQDAGLAPSKLKGSRTGVFIGVQSYDYFTLIASTGAELDAHTATGNAHSIVANRLSYLLDLRGPSLAVDTACSSSLVALHLACQSLRLGESSFALAGGVNLILSPEVTIALSQARMMAADGRCKSFDVRADGYVRSEGCGVVLLKRLVDAIHDRDPIWAVLRGTAVNQDGRSNGLTAPNGPAQEAVITSALEAASLDPGDVDYVEAHGTGTALGDPIEIQALGSVFAAKRVRKLRVGTVKSNIGHLESASGIAGVIKTVLALSEGALPGNVHLREPNPRLGLGALPFEIPTQLVPWPRGRHPRVAGVSSFGFGGTNAHVLLEEAPEVRQTIGEHDRSWHALALTARTPELIQEEARLLLDRVMQEPEIELQDLCWTRNLGRDPQLHRLAIASSSIEDLESKLRAVALGERPGLVFAGQRRPRKPPKIAFLFTGQGAQAYGMGRALFEAEPSFREQMVRAAEIADPHLAAPLLSVLFGGAPDPRIHQTAFTQVALLALEHALAGWWRSLGVEPAVLIGHSVGEIAAAVSAGCIRFEDAMRLVIARGRLMQECKGSMAAVFASRDVVEEAIGEDARWVSIAAINGGDHVVVSGDEGGVERVSGRLVAAGKLVRPLKVSAGFHSPEMDPILDRFRAEALGIEHRPPERALVSNSSGGFHVSAPSADYWTRHIREPVEFAKGARSAAEAGAAIFLEVGPANTLVKLARSAIGDSVEAFIASLDPADEMRSLASAAAQLWALGVEIDWERFDRAHPRTRLRLPGPAYERRRIWFQAPLEAPARGSPTLAELLRAQAPEAVAAIAGGKTVRYADLDPAALPVPLPPRAAIPARNFAEIDRRLARQGDTRHTWLVDSSDPAAVLYALSRGDTLLFDPPAPLAPSARASKPRIDFSLLYFAQEDRQHDNYQLMLEGARFADEHGFSAVWTPEHHFNEIGGPYANPTITSAAIAAATRRVRVHGSLMLPLHHPIRVAEEWAMVDRLSNGRAGIAVDSGLYPNDFVFVPDAYGDRREILVNNLAMIRRLWRGERVSLKNPRGEAVEIEIHPRPIQAEIPLWISAGCMDERYTMAGKMGANVITQIAAQRFDELAQRTVLYRDERRAAGHEGRGCVTLMLHAFIGDDDAEVKEIVRGPMMRQMVLSAKRMADLTKGRGDGEIVADDAQLEMFARLAFEQHFEKNGFFGTPKSVLAKVEAFREIGVDEIACLVDFGVPADRVRESFPKLEQLLHLANPERPAPNAPRAARLEPDMAICTVESIEAALADPAKLAAYASVQRLLFTGRSPSSELTRRIEAKLPRASIVALEKAPSTESAKPSVKEPRADNSPFSAPTNETERVLAEIFGAVLRVPRIGIHDNFFDIGGDSRLSVEIVSRARGAGLPLEPLHIFEHPTIASLAELLRSRA